MHDYGQILTETQKHLARRYTQDPSILNRPGISSACKVDPFYYLILEPRFFEYMSKWSGYSPELIRDTLSRTGNLIRLSGQDSSFVSLDLVIEPGQKPARNRVGFVVADYFDKALIIYARHKDPLEISGLTIKEHQKEDLSRLFEGKTHLSKLAFS